jgi:hypothetical protein
MLRWLKKSTAAVAVIPLMNPTSLARLTMDSKPFIEILAFWELDCKAQVS